MSTLIITGHTRQIIEEVIAFAESHRLDQKKILEHVITKKPVGDDLGYCCIIPPCYRCAFSIEEHPSGWCRHISISVGRTKKFPNVKTTDEILKLFGFWGGIEKIDGAWIEDAGTGIQAVNLVQRYTEGQPSKIKHS